MDRLARPLGELRREYPIVVVGSGYGGAIAACRLSDAGYDVCVLERGKELQPGEYPDTTWKGLKELQARRSTGSLGPRTALFDFRVHRDISVLVGCGLGGTSLINAGVAARAADDIFQDKRWPSKLHGHPEVLTPFYEKAETMLGSRQYPSDWPELAKLSSLEVSAKYLGGEFSRPLINVTFADGLNYAQFEQKACVLCGDCVSGCNHDAKNTVLMNYLPAAARSGAHIFTQAEVRTVVPRGDGTWEVSFSPIGLGRERFGAPTQFVVAHAVVLAAGTLGSTEILLRSRAAGLTVSARVGDGFSGNGDFLAFGYDARHHIHAMGRGRRPPSPRRPVGPTITGLIELPDQHQSDGVAIEEAAAPGPLARLLPTGLALAATVLGQGGDRRPLTVLRWLLGSVLGPYRGPADRTQMFMLMSNDDSQGRIVPTDEGVDVEWRDVADRPVFRRASEKLGRAAAAIQATYVRDPLWESPFGNTLITVHPLGGAAMADDATHGVVNDRGQVFTGADKPPVHETLFVADGSIIPRALAINPLLTISALAERTCDEILNDKAVLARLGAPKKKSERQPAATPTPTSPGLRFTEAMRGWFSPRGAMAKDDVYQGPASQGRADGTSLEFVVTIEFDDLDHLLWNPSAPGRLSGTVVASALSPRRLTVVDGTFHLFEPDPSHVQTVRMGYDMTLVSEAGGSFHLHGEKVLHHGSVRAGWRDTTTMDVRVTDEADDVVGTGVLRLSLDDFARELTTTRILRVADPRERAAYLEAFLRLFLGTLTPLYGGVLVEENRFRPGPASARVHPTPPRLRGVNPPSPVVHWRDHTGWHVGDEPGPGANLRLTRYVRESKGVGELKGPVLIAPGFAMSAWSFASTTTEQNLVECLVDHDYDVWLFDYRACIDLPSATVDFTIDDIAIEDWPAAVARVIEQTGTKKGVHAIGHCVGSVSLMMALLSEALALPDVRSAVCSQFTTHIETSLLGRLKAGLQVGRIMQLLGIRDLTPDTQRTWAHGLVDVTLGAVPVPAHEHCGRALCRWLNSIYGMTHCHAQLNDATHEALAEEFGVGNLHALNQLSLMFRAGKAVDDRGNDVYLRHPERLRLPILFLVGELNYIFHPKGTDRTLKWLKQHNPEHLYATARFEHYAHLDSFIGRDAHRDVFPKIVEHLDQH